MVFYNYTRTTERYTLSLHDALPISDRQEPRRRRGGTREPQDQRSGKHGKSHEHRDRVAGETDKRRSEEHTSELQSQFHLVCRLLLEKKNHPDTNPSPKDPYSR